MDTPNLLEMKNNLLTLLLCLAASALAQTQIGSTLYGLRENGSLGHALSMPSPDVVAIGEPFAGDTGRVGVFTYNGTDWDAQWLRGSSEFAFFGRSVSMPNDSVLAVGAYGENKAYVYSYNGIQWLQDGPPIEPPVGGATTHFLFGSEVHMPDANTLVVSTPTAFSPGVPDHGAVYVYERLGPGSPWVLKGNPLQGIANELFGVSVFMPSASTLAVGATQTLLGGDTTGSVRVYHFSAGTWQQVGNTLYGSGNRQMFGTSVSMPDTSTIAVAAAGFFSNSFSEVNVYEWVGSNWQLKGNALVEGTDLEGPAKSVSMPTPDVLAIGMPLAYPLATNSGAVQLFNYNGQAWQQRGNSIFPGYNEFSFGNEVSMPNPDVVAIGANFTSLFLTLQGSASVYSFQGLEVKQNALFPVRVFPNPTTSSLEINRVPTNRPIYVNVFSTTGQRLAGFLLDESLKFELPDSPGVYFIELNCENHKKVIQVVKH